MRTVHIRKVPPLGGRQREEWPDSQLHGPERRAAIAGHEELPRNGRRESATPFLFL